MKFETTKCTDLLALYLKYHHIEWALVARSVDLDGHIMIVGNEYELRNEWPNQPQAILYHNGVIENELPAETNESLRRMLSVNPHLLWKDLSDSSRKLLIQDKIVAAVWQTVDWLPAAVAWYLATYCTHQEQVMAWECLDKKHAEYWWPKNDDDIINLCKKLEHEGSLSNGQD
jgi:hypothetical protein